MFKPKPTDAWNYDSSHLRNRDAWAGSTEETLPVVNVSGLADFILEPRSPVRIVAGDRGCGKTASLYGKAVKMYGHIEGGVASFGSMPLV